MSDGARPNELQSEPESELDSDDDEDSESELESSLDGGEFLCFRLREFFFDFFGFFFDFRFSVRNGGKPGFSSSEEEELEEESSPGKLADFLFNLFLRLRADFPDLTSSA
jgi:hypothetical protein